MDMSSRPSLVQRKAVERHPKQGVCRTDVANASLLFCPSFLVGNLGTLHAAAKFSHATFFDNVFLPSFRPSFRSFFAIFALGRWSEAAELRNRLLLFSPFSSD